jgi:hypothetical protein
MPKELDLFKMITGESLEDFARLPSFENTLGETIKMLSSNYPLRLLGRSRDGDVYISEEEREANYHIIGAPGEGKSRFIEYNIRKDIKQGNGVCLLDPSDFGDTCYKVLKYCASIGHEKVVLIDPATLAKRGKVACLEPLRKKYLKQSVDGVMEALGVLYGTTRDTDTPRIKRYLPALLRLLANNDLTLYESQWFSNWNPNPPLLGSDRDSLTLKTAFKSQFTWETYFSSTVNRLDNFWQEPLSLMLGADQGIDFVRMVAEGWVILVNLFPSTYLTMSESRLLGVMVISQIVQAVDILRNAGWKGVYYLYMDEAGRYATPQIEQVLTYKRKSGLRLMLAHHYFDQFDNKQVMQAIKQGARIKVMFNTPSYNDRLEMVKDLGYGGDIPPLLASYANQDLPKQYAIVKKNKEAPVRIKVPDTPDIDLEKAELDKYLKEMFKAPWYLTKKEIYDQINARQLQKNPPCPQSGKAPNHQTTGKTAVPGGVPGEAPDGVRPTGKKPSDPKERKPIKI